MSNSKLMPVGYFNPAQQVRLSAYADTIVYEKDGRDLVLRAIRFGGYPEMVDALSDAVYAGAVIEAQIGSETKCFKSMVKRYKRQVSRSGVYAEATLLAIDDDRNAETPEDEEQKKLPSPPRKCTIFCPANDRDRLFAEVDHKTAVPMIPAFRDYLLGELEARGILKKLHVVSIREKLDAWVLSCTEDDANIAAVVEDGLRSGTIAIPGTVTDPNGFDGVTGVTSYLEGPLSNSPRTSRRPIRAVTSLRKLSISTDIHRFRALLRRELSRRSAHVESLRDPSTPSASRWPTASATSSRPSLTRRGSRCPRRCWPSTTMCAKRPATNSTTRSSPWRRPPNGSSGDGKWRSSWRSAAASSAAPLSPRLAGSPARPLRASSFPNRTRFAGLRFGRNRALFQPRLLQRGVRRGGEYL